MSLSRKTKTLLIISTSLLVVALLSIILIEFEKSEPNSAIRTFGDSLWYLIVTLTTVGYGDMYPHSSYGKIVGAVYLFCSYGLLGFLLGKFSNKYNDMKEKRKLGFYGMKNENHVIIIGWNDFTHQVTSQIIRAGKFAAVVTNSKIEIDLIRDIYGEKVFTLFADYDNFDALKKANIDKASNVFVNFDNDTATLVYVLNFRKHYHETKIIVSLNNSNLKQTFNSAGVTYAISKDEIASKLVASYIFEPDIADITEELMATSTNDLEFDLVEYKITSENKYCGIDCFELFVKFREEYDCILLGISKFDGKNRKLIKNPPRGIIVNDGDYVLLMGNGEVKAKLEQDFGFKEGRG